MHSRQLKTKLKIRADYTIPQPMVVSDGIAGSYNPADLPGAAKPAAQLLLGGPSAEAATEAGPAAVKSAGSSANGGQIISYSTAENVKASSALVAPWRQRAQVGP